MENEQTWDVRTPIKVPMYEEAVVTRELIRTQEAPIGYTTRQYQDSMQDSMAVEKMNQTIPLPEKPRGFYLLPYPKDQKPPNNPPTPQTKGHWITVDAGWGMPPVYGFLAIETGLESEEPAAALNAHGHYVFGKMGMEGHVWIWVPEVDSTFGK